MADEQLDHWLIRRLFGISSNPAHRVGNLITGYVGLVLSLFLTGFLLFMALQGPRLGLPDRSDLFAAEGTLREACERKSTVYFSLAEHPDKFDYQSKADDGKSVFRSLTVGAHVSVLHQPPPADYRVGEDRLTVYQIEVGGEMVRSYEQVEEAWVSNNSLGPWLAALFSTFILYFAAYIWLAHRR
jgi:hypothetical protein